MANEPTHLIAQRESRELAARETEGLHVQLLCNPIADAVTVAVEDLRAGEHLHLAVARDHAVDAFYRPFAYAALRTPTRGSRKELTCPA